MNALLLTALLLAPAPSAQVNESRPRVLVIQRSLPLVEVKNGPPRDPNAAIATLLAGEIESSGKVRAIAWSSSDPVFRAALNDGKIAPSSKPDDAEIRRVARILECPFTVVLTCGVNGSEASATLRLEGKATFQTSEKGRVVVGDEGSIESSLQSVVRTLAVRLDTGPFKNLANTAAPEPSPRGQVDPPAPTRTEPDPPQLPPLGDAVAQADRLIAERRPRAAVLLLRDAVDADPFDPNRRRALLRALRLAGFTDAALDSARAALQLTPDPALRLEAARVLIFAGKTEEARTAMNEVLARDAKDVAAHELLGEIALREGNPIRALPHLDAALATDRPAASAFRLRAATRALLGGADGVELDWKRAAEDPSAAPDDIEGDLFEIVDAALVSEGPTLRLLFQKALLRRDSTEVSEGIEAQERLAASVATLSRVAGTSVRYAGPRETRTLALHLLRQCLGELRAFVASGSEDDLASARITLGEALRNLSAARAAHLALRVTDAGTG